MDIIGFIEDGRELVIIVRKKKNFIVRKDLENF